MDYQDKFGRQSQPTSAAGGWIDTLYPSALAISTLNSVSSGVFSFAILIHIMNLSLIIDIFGLIFFSSMLWLHKHVINNPQKYIEKAPANSPIRKYYSSKKPLYTLIFFISLYGILLIIRLTRYFL